MSTRKIYDTYGFGDIDPVIDAVRSIQDHSGLTMGELASRSGVSTTTYYNWKKRKTRRPQFATAAASALALGYDTIRLSAGKVEFVRTKPSAQVIPMKRRA